MWALVGFLVTLIAAVMWYAICLRALIVQAIVRADAYAPGGHPLARIPFNTACRWTFFKPESFPHKMYKQSRGVYEA